MSFEGWSIAINRLGMVPIAAVDDDEGRSVWVKKLYYLLRLTKNTEILSLLRAE